MLMTHRKIQIYFVLMESQRMIVMCYETRHGMIMRDARAREGTQLMCTCAYV